MCDSHYREFKLHLDSLDADEAVAYERECIARGVVLPKSKGGRPKTAVTSPFADIAAKAKALASQTGTKITSSEEIAEAERQVAEAEEILERLTREAAARELKEQMTGPAKGTGRARRKRG